MTPVHPDYPPRARLEWAIASARVVLAAGATLAIWLDPFTPRLDGVLIAYLADSLLVLLLVWSPVRFARSWSLVVHAGDLILVVVLMSFQGPRSPFFIYFMFSVVSGALRWNLAGALWTTAAALSAYVAISLAAGARPLVDDQFIIRCVQLTVAAAMVGYLTAYYSRIQREVLGVAAWPRRIPGDASDVVADVLERAAGIVTALRVLLIWEEPDEEYVNVAWRDEEQRLQWTREPTSVYDPLVAEPLERENFQAHDAANARGRIRILSGGRFRERSGPSINEALRLRFGMRAVQSCRIDGELVHGRVFWLQQRRMRIDDLVMGELVAVLAAARLDAVYSLARLRDSAGLRERMRVARDLHDRILQSLAGLGLQLVVARRLMDRDSLAAAQKLDDIQQQFERVEVDMRNFIRRLRPTPTEQSAGAERLEERCDTLQRRVEMQWPVLVEMDLSSADRPLTHELTDQVFLIVQEGVLNAARHANASRIRVSLHVRDGELQVEISDDGKGFPFSGSYDLAALNAMRAGPLTLKERVAELRGNLRLESSQAGARVVVTLPLAATVS